LTAFTYIAYPEMAKYMRISLFTRAYSGGSGPDDKDTTAIYTKQCFVGPFVPFFSTELPKGDEDFIFLLECNLPGAAKDTEYFLNLFEQEIGIPNADNATTPSPYNVSGIGFDEQFIFRAPLASLKSFDPLILRERIYVKPEETDRVNLTMRISCSFPDVFYVAKLILQNPPPISESEEAEQQTGEEIDPVAFGGRNNWLSSLTQICMQEGKDAVTFPHLELFASCVYILVVELDASRCAKRDALPVNPEPTEEEPAEPEFLWEIEIFADGKVVMGNETMNMTSRHWWRKVGPKRQRPQSKSDKKVQKDPGRNGRKRARMAK